MKSCIYSDWLRWDIHVHAPGTSQNDQFKNDWEAYLTKIEKTIPSVAALGITDYLSINAYKQFLKYHQEGRASNVIFLFPNIEFRLFPNTTKAHPLNVHILVSPHTTDHIQRIDEALSRLKTVFDKETIACDRSGMIRLGKLHRMRTSKKTDDEQAIYLTGIAQFKVDNSQFLEWYQSEQWLSRNSLLAVSGGSDGLAGIRRDSGFKEYHDQLVRQSHLIFSSQQSDRDFFLGRGPDTAEQIESTYGHLKACLHGSDAHSVDKTLEPEGDKSCWIKACPCFDGLRQVMFEPAERVHIGAEPPAHPDPDMVINSILIENHKGWFGTPDLSFSPYLNAIIGEKGTGKTALTDLIAFATGSWRDDETTFLHKARKELTGTKVKIKWASGRESDAEIGKKVELQVPQTRYLSQQFVERLCSGDIMATDLLHEVERVVFDYIPEPERMNCSNFTDLRNKVTGDFHAECIETLKTILENNQSIETLQQTIRTVPQKKAELTKQQNAIKGLKEQLSNLLEGKNNLAVGRVKKLRTQLSELNAAAAGKRDQLNSIDALKGKINRINSKFEELHSSLIEELRKLLVSKEYWNNYLPKFSGDVMTPLKSRREVLLKDLRVLEGEEKDNPGETSIFAIKKLVKIEEDKIQLNETRKKKVKEIQDKIERLDGEIRRLKTEISEADHIYKDLLPQTKQRRMEHYLRYFELLGEERTALEKLYQPLNVKRTSIEQKKYPLEFEVITIVDIKKWVEKGENMLDFRRASSLSRLGALEDLARTFLEDAWHSSDKDKIQNGIEELITTITQDGIESKLRGGFSPRDIADWVFSVDHIHLQYSLKYEGVPLRFLSPGTRGILLLILYLSLDKNDDRPLLIDQPEENLDNASVYDVLVDYFREAKKRRQVIMISHNPNLVVNTDSEQVIIANSKRRKNDLPIIRYEGGPLEVLPESKPIIRELICNILEGGEKAFIKREERYNLINGFLK